MSVQASQRIGDGRIAEGGRPIAACTEGRGGSRRLADDHGAVTVEAAIALGSLLVAVMVCLGALLAASTQVRCVDAAREAARLAARGDEANAAAAARRVAPPNAAVSLRREHEHVVAVVSARTPLLPIELRAEAVAALEPEVAR
ncbi:TadE family type IV pilus minor pilin [Nocardia xishanensis]